MTAVASQSRPAIEAAILHTGPPTQAVRGTVDSLHGSSPLDAGDATELFGNDPSLELALELDVDMLEVAATAHPRNGARRDDPVRIRRNDLDGLPEPVRGLGGVGQSDPNLLPWQ